MAYKIVRHFIGIEGYDWERTIKSGLTLEQAQAHCHDLETSSMTAKGPIVRRIQRRHGPSIEWFDGYSECRR